MHLRGTKKRDPVRHLSTRNHAGFAFGTGHGIGRNEHCGLHQRHIWQWNARVAAESLPCGMKVEVCSGSTISRGEICRCEQNADGSAMAGIKIFRSAPVGTQLEQLNDSLREVIPVYERLRAND